LWAGVKSTKDSETWKETTGIFICKDYLYKQIYLLELNPLQPKLILEI